MKEEKDAISIQNSISRGRGEQKARVLSPGSGFYYSKMGPGFFRTGLLKDRSRAGPGSGKRSGTENACLPGIGPGQALFGLFLGPLFSL